MRRAAAPLALLLATAPAGAAPEPATFNWAWLRQTPPDAVSRQLFGALGQIMYLQPNQIPSTDNLLRPLRTLRFLGQPRASYRAGLCETDWVTVEFERAPFALGPDPAARPRRLTVSTAFLVQNLAQVREGEPVVEEALVALNVACAAIDPREAQPVIADSAFAVTGVIGLLADLIEAARAGRALAPLECHDEQGEVRASGDCLRDLARLRPEQAFYASLSGGCDPNDAGIFCRNGSVHDLGQAIEIRFELRRGAAAPFRIVVRPAQDTSSIE